MVAMNNPNLRNNIKYQLGAEKLRMGMACERETYRFAIVSDLISLDKCIWYDSVEFKGMEFFFKLQWSEN